MSKPAGAENVIGIVQEPDGCGMDGCGPSLGPGAAETAKCEASGLMLGAWAACGPLPGGWACGICGCVPGGALMPC